VSQEKDWIDRMVDRIGQWMDSLSDRDDYTELATQFWQEPEAETETSGSPPSKSTTETL